MLPADMFMSLYKLHN